MCLRYYILAYQLFYTLPLVSTFLNGKKYIYVCIYMYEYMYVCVCDFTIKFVMHYCCKTKFFNFLALILTYLSIFCLSISLYFQMSYALFISFLLDDYIVHILFLRRYWFDLGWLYCTILFSLRNTKFLILLFILGNLYFVK